jgi:hypothetical protein
LVRGAFILPGGKAQCELLPTVVRELGHTLDEVLLVGLAEGQPVEPSLSAELIKTAGLTGIGQDHEQPIYFFSGT